MTDAKVKTLERKPGRLTPGASRYLKKEWGLSYAPTSLARMACMGTGPVYSYRGRYREYQDADLDAFARSKLRGRRRKASDTSEMRVA